MIYDTKMGLYYLISDKEQRKWRNDHCKTKWCDDIAILNKEQSKITERYVALVTYTPTSKRKRRERKMTPTYQQKMHIKLIMEDRLSEDKQL
jgi:hypothetical protein